VLFCVASVDAARLTTVIVAGCENVTGTFLLTCFGFLSDIATRVNLLPSTPVSSVEELARAAGSCQSVNSCNVVSRQSFCHKLKQCDDSASFRRRCAADVCSKELCSLVALSHTQKWRNVDIGNCADQPVLLPFIADHVVSHSSVNQHAVRHCQSTVNCDRMNQSPMKYCSRITCDDHSCTTKSYKLEHLDISGCWKITDLSIRSV